MIDQLGFSRPTGCFGEFAVSCQHIDQGTLSYIGSPDKGKFRFVWFRALGMICITYQKDRFLDHGIFLFGTKVNEFKLILGSEIFH
jgi:hypothetical protein